jgi:hypothetical protein
VVRRCVFPRYDWHTRHAGQKLVCPEHRECLLTRFGGSICLITRKIVNFALAAV